MEIPEKLALFLSDPKQAEAYKAWLEDPMTEFVLDQASLAARPTPLLNTAIDEGQALYIHGIDVGATMAIQLIKNALDIVTAPNQQVSDAMAYNAEAYMRMAGYSEEAISKLKASKTGGTP